VESEETPKIPHFEEIIAEWIKNVDSIKPDSVTIPSESSAQLKKESSREKFSSSLGQTDLRNIFMAPFFQTDLRLKTTSVSGD